MKLSNLKKIFSQGINVNLIANSNAALKNTMNEINSNQLLIILGSHYWGDYIYKNF